MKNKALITLILILGSASLYAQTTTETSNPRFRMGLAVSPAVSWFSPEGNEVSGEGIRFNIKYGLHMDLGLGSNQNYYFSTGLFVLNSGGTIQHEYFARQDQNSDFRLTERTIDYRLNYVNIPLTMMLRTNEVGYIVYYGRVGFDVGFNIKAEIDREDVPIEGMAESTFNGEDEDASEFVNLFRTALHLELGVEYKLTGNTRFFAGVEWNNGLNNIFDKDYKLPSGTEVNGGLPVNQDTGLPFVEEKIEAQLHSIMLNVGVYF